ncbi:MAG: dihydropteroate synthase [Chloroflexi bacterium]|nr:dihydropteroate synthase [Chloroflexota bacterium]
MIVVGESLNGTLAGPQRAILAHNEAWIQQMALDQIRCGAQMLDVNSGGISQDREVEDLVWMVEAIQAVAQVPLVLDSSNAKAIEAAAKVYRGKSLLLSSISVERRNLESAPAILSLASEKGCGVVALCIGPQAIPVTAQGRLAIANTLYEMAMTRGITAENLYFDPIVSPVGTQAQAGTVALETTRLIKEHLPGARTIVGVSNISYGLPRRKLLNGAFLAMLAAAGVDACIVDVRDLGLMSILRAAQAVAGQDKMCKDYIRAYRAGSLQ